jgi:two-component system, NtrC family, nitrogen regulation sensor histidine kinase NtrY
MNILLEWLSRYKLLVLFLVFLILAFFFERRASNYQTQELSLERIQTTISNKEAKTDQKIDEIESRIAKKGLKNFIRDDSAEYFRFSASKGISFAVYENDQLVYWSNNSIVLEPAFSENGFKNQLFQSPNSWHVVHVKEFEDRKIVGFIKIKTSYAFENAFLKNQFQKSFGAGLDAKISPERIEGSEVFSKDGSFLFSLSTQENETPAYLPFIAGIFYFLVLVFLLLLILQWFRWLVIKTQINRNILITITVGLLIFLRFLMLQYGYPTFLSTLPLFEPYHYAKSFWFPNLGDFFLNTFLLLFISFLVFREFDYFGMQKRGLKPALCLFITTFFITIYYLFFHYLLRGLVMNSSILIEVYNVFYLNTYTLIGYFGIAFLILSLLLFLDKFVSVYAEDFSFWKFSGFVTAFVLMVFLPFMLADKTVTISQLLFLLIFIFIISWLRLVKKSYSYANKLLILFFASVFTLFFLAELSVSKERNIRKVMAVNLANERDQVAEFLLEEAEVNLKTDTTLAKMLKNLELYDFEIFEYLDNRYFSRFFTKYEMQIASCAQDEDLYLEDTDELVDCFAFFTNMIEENGVNIFPGSGFYYLDNQNGRISYLGIIVFNFNEFPFERKLYISLDSKLLIEPLGYPELLLEGKFGKTNPLSDYSYAKYFREKLISRSGSYTYALEFNYMDDFTDEMVSLTLDGYNHLFYKVDKDNIVILSKQEVKPIDLITSFSYIFIFYFLLYSLLVLLVYRSPRAYSFRSNFKNRIKFAMIGILLLSLLIVGVGTVAYNISQFRQKHYDTISEKIQSVLIELEHKLFLEEELGPDLQSYVSELFVKWSNVFYTDINLFDLEGNLYATSRPEVFELGLTGTRIHPLAYREMYINKNAKYIHDENIGDLSFVSAYVPFTNANNEVLAYLNLPYFTKQQVLRKEIYTLVVAVANIYALLILLTLLVALFITNRITEPLKLIQDRLRMISLGRNNKPLVYDADDEIGSLVKDYNRMVAELGESAELLAKSERESAWREMAKQIAHEIKNPLTPMKLSLQHLQRAWEDKVENWDEVFKRTTNTLVEQIDNLSRISSEFSNFAQMPRATNEKVNIVQKVKDVISLFTPAEEAEITYDAQGEKDLFVYIDKEQLSRVFINLIKNALQSIPQNRNGQIHIELRKDKGRIRVNVSDNGKGIPPEQQPRMFQPNFTTKTSGMGLGLAIVKNIVEHAGGHITYETTQNKGSSFEFDLPAFRENL